MAPQDHLPPGQPLRPDPDAPSASTALPAFLARPAGAPVYHGFPLVPESRTPDGWCFGMITELDCPDGNDWGDAFVVAPDDRPGRPRLADRADQTGGRPGAGRRPVGVYGVPISRPVHTQAELMAELAAWLPALRRRHAAWADRPSPPPTPAQAAGHEADHGDGDEPSADSHVRS
ncbi:MAG: hypothetical protein U0871_07100 [Gemmataceae bacterium]